MKENYQRQLEEVIQNVKQEGKCPQLLLHSCCAPCSSYVLEYLAEIFSITLFFYNPNISPREEYEKRLAELKGLLVKMALSDIQVIEAPYDHERFLKLSEGLEDLPEGGERCFGCYGLRLYETARAAAEGGYDYFTTTLSISPHKNAQKLNEIGQAAAGKWGAVWLPSDFKKKNGYKRSVELSETYGLYRQNYCGCRFSREAADRRENR